MPVHYFALIRLPLIYRRLDEDDELRGWFVRCCPGSMLAEWAMGVSAMRYAVKPRPSLRGQSGQGFR